MSEIKSGGAQPNDGSLRRILAIVPALNEVDSIESVVQEISAVGLVDRVLVVDDGSIDGTADAARRSGAEVVSNVFNLGVGGAMRVGFKYAAAAGYDVAVQIDGDGQHNPAELATLISFLDEGESPCIVVGARFAGAEYAEDVPKLRRFAMWVLSRYVSWIIGVRLSDVTSGFRVHNRAAIDLFSRSYPAEYLADTVESLLIAHAVGGSIVQYPVHMRQRLGGQATNRSWRGVMQLMRVAMMVMMMSTRRRSTIASAQGGGRTR